MIYDNLQRVRDEIDRAAERSGRTADDITLVAVSKNHTAAEVRDALAAGVVHLGENRVQEAEGKIPDVGGSPVWHLIGHLQSNKASRAAGLFQWVDSVDSKKVADRLSAKAFELGHELQILVQVNVSGEAVKSGIDPSGIQELVAYVSGLESLTVRGLMTIGSFGADEGRSRSEFAAMRTLFEECRNMPGLSSSMQVLSMGMSGDYGIAIEEGATMVRVGTAIFGSRGY